MLHRSLFICSLVLFGCSSGGGSSDDGGVDAGPDLLPFAAPHPSLPQAQSQGGPVVASPKFVAISFQDDTAQTTIDDFVSKLAASKYWNGAVGEYGVGAATALKPVHIAMNAPLTIADKAIQNFLTMQINTTPQFPQPDANTIYAVFYPMTTTVTDPGGARSCGLFNGYHNDYAITPGKFVTYIVMPRCPGPTPSVTLIDMMTATASHEFIEAATDPLAFDNPAYSIVDQDHAVWGTLGGAEIGDLCAPFPTVFYKPADLPYLVQRVWSNQAAAAGHDPCQPDGNNPYFNSAPVLNDTVNPQILGMTKGVTIPVGQSAVVELDLFSDAPTSGPWTVSAFDINAMFMGQPQELQLTFDKTTGQNGDKINLTIKALKADPQGMSPFWIQSDLGKSSAVWIGIVGN
jgi:hypothetical protein